MGQPLGALSVRGIIGIAKMSRVGRAGLGWLALGLAIAGGPARAADNDWIRPYLKLQIGNSYFTDSDSVPEATLESPPPPASPALA